MRSNRKIIVFAGQAFVRQSTESRDIQQFTFMSAIHVYEWMVGPGALAGAAFEPNENKFAAAALGRRIDNRIQSLASQILQFGNRFS